MSPSEIIASVRIILYYYCDRACQPHNIMLYNTRTNGYWPLGAVYNVISICIRRPELKISDSPLFRQKSAQLLLRPRATRYPYTFMFSRWFALNTQHRQPLCFRIVPTPPQGRAFKKSHVIYYYYKTYADRFPVPVPT